MADNILYNFGANAGSLTDINGMLNNIQEVRQTSARSSRR